MTSSHSIEKSDAGSIGSAAGEAQRRYPVLATCSASAAGSIPAGLWIAPPDVGDRDDPHAERGEQEDERRPDLAVALDDGARPGELKTEFLEGRLRAEHYARRGGADVTDDPSNGNRLAGHDSWSDVARASSRRCP